MNVFFALKGSKLLLLLIINNFVKTSLSTERNIPKDVLCATRLSKAVMQCAFAFTDIVCLTEVEA